MHTNAISTLFYHLFILRLSDLHQKLLNSMSPIERALLENEENKALENVDINDASSSSLGKHERVQKATLVCLNYLLCLP